MRERKRKKDAKKRRAKAFNGEACLSNENCSRHWNFGVMAEAKMVVFHGNGQMEEHFL
jgi:hypothetical protein